MGVQIVTKEMKMIAGGAICVMLLLVGVSFAIASEPPVGDAIYDLPEPEVAPESESEPEAVSAGYVVRSDGEGVGVYSHGGERLMELDIQPAKLREADAEKFERGIEVADDEELWRLIEDFSS